MEAGTEGACGSISSSRALKPERPPHETAQMHPCWIKEVELTRYRKPDASQHSFCSSAEASSSRRRRDGKYISCTP